MTPAAALTQAAMDVTPAYAVDTTEDRVLDATVAIPVDADKVGDATHDPAGMGWQLPTVSGASTDVSLPYTGEDQKDSPKITAGVTLGDVQYKYYATGNNDKTTINYTVPQSYLTPTFFTTTGGSPTSVSEVKNVGDYTVKYQVAAPDGVAAVPGFTSGIAGLNGQLESAPTNTRALKITAATATVEVPPTAILGVATPESIAKSVVVEGVGNDELKYDTDYTVAINDENGSPLTGSGAITEPQTVTVVVALKPGSALAGNYVLPASYPNKVAVKASGTYEASFVNDKTNNPTLEATSGGKSATVAWDSRANNIDDAVEKGLTVMSGKTKLDYVVNNPASSAYKIAYTNAAGEPMLEADGVTPDTPSLPGNYGVAVTVNGESKPFATLGLKVVADLGKDVSYKVGGYDTATETVRLLWDKDLADDPAARDAYVVEQIKEGFSAALKNSPTNTPVSVDDLLFEVTTTVNSPNGGTGVVTVKPASPSGLYVGNCAIKYGYGDVMPAFGLKKASEPYNDTVGYTVNELVKVPVVQGSDGKPGDFSDYSVIAKYVNADGKTVTVEGANKITNVGDYQIVVSGTGTYAGSQAFDFKIDPRPITKGEVSWFGNESGVEYDSKDKVWYLTYKGTALEPAPKVSVMLTDKSNVDLVDKASRTEEQVEADAPWDYEVSWSNNTNVGTATATVTFSGNYSGTVELPFEIVGSSLNDLKATATAQSQLAEGFPANPTGEDVLNPVVSYSTVVNGKKKTIELDPEDYVIKSVTKGVTGADGVTSYTFVVEGQGNYSGTIEGAFNTVPKAKDISTLWTVDVAAGNYFYQMGEPVEAGVVVKTKPATSSATGSPVSQTAPGQKTPNYRVTYKDNVDAGTATVIVSGDGQYAGSIEKTFEIAPLQISQESAANVDLSQESFVYAPGIEAKPEVVMGTSEITPVNEGYDGGAVKLKEIVDDIAVTYANNTAAGTAQAIISGKEGGNVSGSYAVDFEIAQADIADATVEAANVVPGASAADAVKVTLGDDVLAAGTDYTVAAEGALPGKVTATVTGTGNYTGTATADVDVLYDVAGLSYKVSSGTYNGQSQTPVVTASYKDAAGKTVEVPASALNVAAGSYVNAGTYKIKVTGNNAAGWGGETTVDYTIAPATVTAKPQVSYAGGLPVVTVPGLTSNDFDWKADAATKTITVTYKGNYKGTAKVAYTPTVAPGDPGSVAGKTGWVGSGNDWAYYEGGKQVKDQWKLIGGEWYHFEKSGKMTNTKWFQDTDGEWYLLNQSHKGSYGAMLTGWQKVDGGWYYLNKSGAMQSGWLKDGGEWYLLNTAHDGTFGKMLTGWQQDADGKWYYMDASGAMASNAWVGRYWVNGSGVWTATR
ncbi:N-acetylmuramoyl-L-alanine amidase family protein [Xiamenia xianingshaonis]|nr:hypothetical protein [Xiamenia xianingshaonis]QTU85013.1 hypothetical protein J7S26_03665 [Xiamenia xianingshaonis]